MLGEEPRKEPRKAVTERGQEKTGAGRGRELRREREENDQPIDGLVSSTYYVPGTALGRKRQQRAKGRRG